MLEKLQMRLSDKQKDLIGIIFSFIYIPEIILLSIIAKIKYKNINDIWLICERGTEAKDNGYKFFKYIKNNDLHDNVYYVMDKNNLADYEKVKKIGNIIQYRSIEHKLMYICSRKLISTHINTIIPWRFSRYKNFSKFFKFIISKKKLVFLQHGIIKEDLSSYYGKESADIDLFICSAKPEYKYVIDNFGYNENEVCYTGLARFDDLIEYKTTQTILIMPTWRRLLRGVSEKEFITSQYYNEFQNLINDKDLINFLEEKKLKVVFYPHHEVQPYLNLFSSNSNKIILADKDRYDVQELLKEAKILVTDFSSVYFDFAYMNKPIIYYQFDADSGYKEHRKDGYFDYERDGFGPIVNKGKECINYIKQIYKNNYKMEEKYEDRINDFFELKDDRNCERIYNNICKI